MVGRGITNLGPLCFALSLDLPDMTPREILTIKLRYLGDVLLATPTWHALKAAYPTARLTVVVNRGTEEILHANEDVDEIIPLERGSLLEQARFVAAIRCRRFELVVDLTDGDRAAVLTRFSGASVRIGFNDEHRWTQRCYTTVVRGDAGAHRIERDLAALRPLGIYASERTPRLRLTQDDDRHADELIDRLEVRQDRPFVIIQPGARYWFKAWPSERFAVLADRLADDGYQVLVGGSEEECALVHRVVSQAKHPLITLAGRSSIRTFAALLKRAALFVGNDTGAMHIAAAVGTPLVALFGPSNPREWGPRSEQATVLYKGLDCRLCFHPTCERGELNCMKQISVAEVVRSVSEVLQSSQSRPAGAYERHEPRMPLSSP